IEPFLVAEIVIDHALGGARLGRDLIDARTRQTIRGELRRRDSKDVRLHACWILLPATAVHALLQVQAYLAHARNLHVRNAFYTNELVRSKRLRELTR